VKRFHSLAYCKKCMKCKKEEIVSYIYSREYR